MQNPFHFRKILVCTVFLTNFGISTCIVADPSAPESPRDKTSQLRLFAASGFQDFYRAGIEIRLKPDALTYWRQPGDAGVPPVFSFEGSINLAAAAVLYPAPFRIKEDEGEAFGYQDKVVFPVHVTPRDKTQPLTLKLTADYAVCERICVPVRSRTEITLPPAQNPSQDAAVATAEASVPQRLTQAETTEKLVLQPEKNAIHPSWRLHWKDNSPATDLFAEAPEGWYFETKKTDRANEFTIVAVETPKTPGDAAIPVTLTLTSPHKNFEFTLPFDAANPLH